MKMARRLAAADPMAGWAKREVFPGPEVQADDDLAEIMRATNHTVYHVSCTCRIGPDHDPLAVLGPQLRVRGVRGLSVADASAFPSLTTVNPVIAVMMLGERAADLIRGAPRLAVMPPQLLPRGVCVAGSAPMPAAPS
jgi:choline dehydrogenase